MAHIEYFFATTSPFTYLAGTRMEEVAARHGATVTYRPLDVVALFARTGGKPPKERHPARLDYRLQELRRLSKKLGLPINLDPPYRAVNPAPSGLLERPSTSLTGPRNSGVRTGSRIWICTCRDSFERTDTSLGKRGCALGLSAALHIGPWRGVETVGATSVGQIPSGCTRYGGPREGARGRPDRGLP
jgi:hypothetical protein